MVISQQSLFKIALYSNALYVCLLFLFQPNGINIEKIVITSFLLLSVCAILLLVIKNKSKLKDIPKTARYTFYLLLFWSTIVVVRGFSLNIQDWVTNFGNVYMALAWFVPCVLILGRKIELWNMVFKALLFMFTLMVVASLTLPFQEDIKTEWTWLLRPVNFVLIIGLYKKALLNKIMTVIALILYVIITLKVEQRIEFLFLFLVAVFLVIDKLKQVKIKKQFLKYILFGFLVVLVLIFTYGYENISNIVMLVIDFQDSRTFLFNELFTELSPLEKVFGRGSLGTYYSEFFENTRRYYELMGRTGWAGDMPDRITTEVGFLQMILKGGFLLFFLTAFLMLYSAYIGIFKSRNKFCKQLGIYILILSILSIVSFRPAFTPTFIILWLAIGTVLNKNNRDLTDAEIKTILKI